MQHFQVVCRTVAISNKSILSIMKGAFPQWVCTFFRLPLYAAFSNDKQPAPSPG